MASKSRLGPSGYGIARKGSFAGKAVDAGIVVDAFLAGMAASTAISKPGVPSGTPDWLKTVIEIILGRRGNKIAVPPLQNLTFSATPTQAECQALYSYLNTVRDSVDQLINRLDS